MTIDAEDPRGFSVLETLVATTILAVAVSGLAHLFVLAARANTIAAATTAATLAAQQKMEELRGLTFGFDAAGDAVTDAGLTASPADALDVDTAGYWDFVDRFGRTVAGDPPPPGGAVYVRRWSIEPLADDPIGTLVLQVRVVRAGRRPAARPAAHGRMQDEARLVAVRTRKGP
jgi:prepilin-type N-terminal cleavage/methylation domain-containing protein